MTTAPAVLYIEDDPLNQMLVAQLVARRQDGAELLGATTGSAGLAIAADRKPNLIMLDLGLPDVSGREVLATLRTNRDLDQTPIMILSGEPAADHEEGLIAAGADAYVMKPFNILDVMQLMGQLLERGRVHT